MIDCISHREATIQSFRRDPEFARFFLESVLADGDAEEIKIAEEWVSEALCQPPSPNVVAVA